MVNTKEQFVLALQGWKYKGTLDDIYHSPGNLGYIFGTVKNSTIRTCIPNSVIKTQTHKKNDTTILFLTDYTYYTLGTKQNE